jgi:hypothetical protein
MQRITFTRRFASQLPSVRTRARPNFKSTDQEIVTMEDALRWRDMSPRQKVVYATKQTSYTGVIVAGLGLTSVLFYLVGAELFSKSDERIVYDLALDRIRGVDQVVELLGEPVVGVVEQSGRRGRRSLSQQLKLDVREGFSGGEKTAFMRFPVTGSVNEAWVNVWVKQRGTNRWQIEHINVELPSGKRIVVEDFRQ